MTQIYNTFSGELLRWPDNSFFIPFKFLNVWLFLNLIKPFIRWDKTVFSSYFDTECIHWIDLIRNVFLTKNSIWVALIFILESQIPCSLCRSLGLCRKIQLRWEGHPWKIKKSEETYFGTWVKRRKSIVRLTTQHSLETSSTALLLYMKQFDCFMNWTYRERKQPHKMYL